MMRQHFHLSPFHQALHFWGIISQGTPLLHVDLHGKGDRDNNCEIDLGIKSMEMHWKNDSLVHQIRHFFEKEGDIFGNLTFNKGYKCRFNPNPKSLTGFWGGQVHTMTEQAIMMGIASFQLEIPLSVRKRLLVD